MPQGFLRAYDSVRARVLGIACEVLKEDAHAWRIYVTGHSLGGALATLCTYELANRRCARLGLDMALLIMIIFSFEVAQHALQSLTPLYGTYLLPSVSS